MERRLSHSSSDSASSSRLNDDSTLCDREKLDDTFRGTSSGGSCTPDTDTSVLFDDETGLSRSGVIVVVGGLGYIGSHTTLELALAGYSVVILDDLSNSFEHVYTNLVKLVKDHYSSDEQQRAGRAAPELKLYRVDYKCSQRVREILQEYGNIAGVIHFAAFKSVEQSIYNPLSYYRNNVCGLVEFLELLGELNVKNFVFSSSATVYGSKANRGYPVHEHEVIHHAANVKSTPATKSQSSYSQVESKLGLTTHEANNVSSSIELSERGEVINHMDGNSNGGKPNHTVQGAVLEPSVEGLSSPYSRTKYMCEAILADLAYSDPSWSITLLRYFNPIGCHSSGLLGEHPKQPPTNLVPVLIRSILGEIPEFEIYGADYNTTDGTAVRDFIHVQDLAKGHIAALAAAAQRPCQGLKTYNLGTGQGHTVKEVLASMQKAAGKSLNVKVVDRRKGDIGFCVAGVDKVHHELIWKAEKSLDECTRDVWNYTLKSRIASNAP